MLKDIISNVKNYNNYNELLVKGLEYIYATDFSQIKDGKYLLSGEELYANIQTYQTKSDADFEAHRKYIDIQYIISGAELIGVTEYKACSTTIEYNAEKDIEFLNGEGEMIPLTKGEFMILYPEDAHKPSISADKNNPIEVRKVVVKVSIK